MSPHTTPFSKKKLRWWHLPLGVALFGAGGWFGLFEATHILSAEAITYTKKGFPARTVSPANGAFEYYYQVAFFMCLGVFGSLLAVAGVLASSMYFIGTVESVKRLGRLLAYASLPFGCAWLLLHMGRYWLI
jgi:hypothetical protein